MVTVPVAAPSSVDEVAATLRAAERDGAAVLSRGAGTKVHWGSSPGPVDLVLDVRRLTGIVAHQPGDLVATVRAGTALRDVQAVLALSGQRLALESAAPEATIGGVLATGEAGPLRLRYGAGRDLLLGVEFVRADGVVAHAGGRVVKNVAGYDLGRLLCGSYGTLGVLTEATFRLHPLPAAQCWVTRTVSLPELAAAVTAALDPRISPSAVELDLTAGAGTLAVLIEGSRAGVPVRAEAAIRGLGGDVVAGGRPPWWGSYPFAAEGIGIKLAVALDRLPAVLAALRAGSHGVPVRGSAGAGVLYAGLPATTSAAELDEILRSARAAAGNGSAVVLSAPAAVRDAVDGWGPVPGLALMRRVKDQFDPHRRFVAGRFVGGI
ncbi:MAG TPA: FAD-binding oxidoreductase [Micromonosporaceae bacterium]